MVSFYITGSRWILQQISREVSSFCINSFFTIGNIISFLMSTLSLLCYFLEENVFCLSSKEPNNVMILEWCHL